MRTRWLQELSLIDFLPRAVLAPLASSFPSPHRVNDTALSASASAVKQIAQSMLGMAANRFNPAGKASSVSARPLPSPCA